jgi:aldehyde:ferredoxin oxidoreductase
LGHLERFGYHGKVLRIDLSGKRSWVEEPDDRFWRTYGGGGLLATVYLLGETPTGLDAFDPENRLTFASSVVAGHPYVGLAQFMVGAKSPLSGGIGEARCEGPFGIVLKQSGADAIVMQGAADKLTTLLIEDGQVRFLDATDLAGLPVNATVDRLEAQFGADIHTAVIGPAGERRVRFASIVSDRTHQAARTGMGAVMGSKNLKALVIAGGERPRVADPARCDAITTSYAARMGDNPLTRWQLEPPGFAAWVHTHGIEAALCTHNYRDSVFGAADTYAPELFMQRYRGEAVCPGCPNNCIKVFGTDDGNAFDARAGGMHQEITGAIGSNLGLDDVEALFQVNILCNELGMDPNALGFTLSMAMECVEEGILAESTVGLPLRFGNAPATIAMVRQIAHREGFGDVLAEGVRRAANHIGPDAARYALHVKGQEMVPFEPRTQTNLALGYATAPVGPRYVVCEHDWDYDPDVGWPHTMEGSRTLGILQRVPMEYLGADKVRNFKALNTLWSAADVLAMSIFAIAPTRVLSLDEMADLLAAVTGWTTSSYELMRFGERRNHLMRVYNVREGLTAAADTLPDRFFDEPIPQGVWTGTRLDRAAFHDAIRTYYRMMGWDDEGRPHYETLLDHHLEWAANDSQTVLS